MVQILSLISLIVFRVVVIGSHRHLRSVHKNVHIACATKSATCCFTIKITLWKFVYWCHKPSYELIWTNHCASTCFLPVLVSVYSQTGFYLWAVLFLVWNMSYMYVFPCTVCILLETLSFQCSSWWPLQEQYSIDFLLIILRKILYGPILMPALE